MKAFYTILLLVVSNIFMTFAWYGHLKLQEMKVISNWPLYAVILFSWAIALAEYSFQVPANRIGFVENGGPFSLMQLKVIQEVITLMIFTLFTTVFFKGSRARRCTGTTSPPSSAWYWPSTSCSTSDEGDSKDCAFQFRVYKKAMLSVRQVIVLSGKKHRFLFMQKYV